MIKIVGITGLDGLSRWIGRHDYVRQAADGRRS